MARLQTHRVFQARSGAFSPPGGPFAPCADAAALAEALALRRNDLTQPAIRLKPQIRVVLDALGAAEGCLRARMSGSGATCFRLFADSELAVRAAAAIAGAHRSWWVCATRLIGDTSTLGRPDLDAGAPRARRPPAPPPPNQRTPADCATSPYARTRPA